jgi:hypothetical protein
MRRLSLGERDNRGCALVTVPLSATKVWDGYSSVMRIKTSAYVEDG